MSVPAPRRVAPPPNYDKPPDALWTPEERRTLLEFEKEKSLADKVACWGLARGGVRQAERGRTRRGEGRRWTGTRTLFGAAGAGVGGQEVLEQC